MKNNFGEVKRESRKKRVRKQIKKNVSDAFGFCCEFQKVEFYRSNCD